MEDSPLLGVEGASFIDASSRKMGRSSQATANMYGEPSGAAHAQRTVVSSPALLDFRWWVLMTEKTLAGFLPSSSYGRGWKEGTSAAQESGGGLSAFAFIIFAATLAVVHSPPPDFYAP